MGAVARVSGEQYPAPTGRNQESTPQRAVAVDHAPRREMLSRRQRDRKRHLARALPPVEFHDVTDAGRSQQPPVTDRCHYRRMKAPLERAQGPEIAVIVVIMTEEHECDGGQIVESRSEEHTSELQSRLHLVCRLLLEKKKHIL